MSAPFDVRFEHRRCGEPALGVGTSTPRTSWRTHEKAEAPATLEITRTPWGGEPATSTHEVPAGEQLYVAWPADPLGHLEQASVRVRVGDGEWSEPAVVEAGPEQWQARFVSPSQIGGLGEPAPAVGTTFTVDGDVRRARLLVSAHGIADVLVNGQPASDDLLTPGWTSYDQRIRYYAHDVTELVHQGENQLEALLGNGWWRGHLTWDMRQAVYGDRLAALVQLELELADGSTTVVASDGSWQARRTNVLADDLYNGSSLDLRLPVVGEEAGGVDVLDDQLENLIAAEGPAVRRVEEVAAQKVWRSPSGKLLVDFGQNLVGWVRITARGHQAGDEVTIRHAEVLEHDELGTRPLRNAKATDHYVLAGGDEVLEPRFTFHGFRYVEVEGLDDLTAEDLTGVVISSDLQRTGWFESSSELVDQLHSNVVWGMRGNFVDIPTDCPQRDERLGWTGDIQVFSPTAAYLADSIGFLYDWTRNLAADQRADGRVPIVSPDVLQADFGACAWGDAATIVPWNLYQASGDEQILRSQLDSMRGWVDWIGTKATDDLWLGGFQFGDWLDPDAPPESPAEAKADQDICATGCWYRCADVVAQAAAVLGETELQQQYRELADRIRAAFQRRFVTPDGRILSDCQTVYGLAICWGLLDDNQLPLAGDRLADLVRLGGFRIGTGFIGTPLVTEALSLTGHTDVAYRLLEQTQCPSWLYPVTMGATTIWERWDSMLPDGTINPGEMTSFNHYALGAVADWLHSRVAGLQLVEPGYRRFLIAPEPGGSFTRAATRHLSPYGEIAVSWELDGRTLAVKATVPAGTEALLWLPGSEPVEVGPGEHEWSCQLPELQTGRPTTVREVVDDAELWGKVSGVVLEHTQLPTDREALKMLARSMDEPAEIIVRLITADGMMPGGKEAIEAAKPLFA